jgi:glutamine cyclotransferase
MKKNILISILSALFILACTPENPLDNEYHKSTGVFVVNEGNFTYGNASLSFLDLQTGELENQVFFKANGFPLGDVAYSMTIHDSTAFIAINNSGKIFAFNTNSFKHRGTLAGLISPRFIHIVNAQKGYISDLYSMILKEFNPSTLTLTDSVIVGRSTEQMLHLDNYLYTNSWSFGNEIIKIDMSTNEVVAVAEVHKQPNSMVLDKHNKIWILSDGGFEGSQLGVDYPALTQLDPSTMEIQNTLVFSSLSASPNNLIINQTRDTLSYIYGSWSGNIDFESGIYQMPITATSLPTEALIPEETHRFYRMGIDPSSSIIYVSDALDYLQRGYVFRFNPDGSLIDSLQADRIPAFFAFK